LERDGGSSLGTPFRGWLQRSFRDD